MRKRLGALPLLVCLFAAATAKADAFEDRYPLDEVWVGVNIVKTADGHVDFASKDILLSTINRGGDGFYTLDFELALEAHATKMQRAEVPASTPSTREQLAAQKHD